jgi:hypothetical protein
MTQEERTGWNRFEYFARAPLHFLEKNGLLSSARAQRA